MRNPLAEVPAYNDMMCELFQAMKELGGSGTIREIDDKTVEILKLPIEIQEIMHGNSSKTEVEYRLAWTRTYMKKVGILENSSRGVWSLTTTGRELEKINPEEVVQKVWIVNTFLDNFFKVVLPVLYRGLISQRGMYSVIVIPVHIIP